MPRFTKLLGWMATEKVDQPELTRRINLIRGERAKPRSLSAINRLLLGQVRFADPFLASEIEGVTEEAVSVADYLGHIAASQQQKSRRPRRRAA